MSSYTFQINLMLLIVVYPGTIMSLEWDLFDRPVFEKPV